MFTIYKYTSPSNKVYIGQTCQTQNERAKGGEGYKPCIAFYRAIEKYGFDNLKYEVLALVPTKEEANELEQYYIKKYQSMNPEYGYNIREGGNSNRTIEYIDKLNQMKKMWEEGKTVHDIAVCFPEYSQGEITYDLV